MNAPAPSNTPSTSEDAGQREISLAMANAFKLGMSLISTVAIGVIVNFWLPNYVDTINFGKLTWAESFATTAFIVVNFGVDHYIRREISIRPAHAADFYGGVMVIRLLSSILSVLGMAAVLHYGRHADALEWQLAFLFALGQAAIIFTKTQSTLLASVGHVDEVAVINIVCKLLWAGGILGGIALHWDLRLVTCMAAAALAVSETVKAIAYGAVLKRRLELPFRVDLREAWRVIVVSTPYFLNMLCHVFYERVGVLMIPIAGTDEEVGYYGAALRIAGLTTLLIPIVIQVVMPMGMRIGEKSEEQMNEAMRAAVRIVFVTCTCGALILFLHASDFISVLFNPSYAPATRALRVLAPMFPVTYIAIVLSLHLNMLGRIWLLVQVSVVGLVLTPLLNGVLILTLSEHYAPGSGGVVCAIAALATEIVVVALMMVRLKAAAVDRHLWLTLAKTGGICLVIVGLFEGVPWHGVLTTPVMRFLLVPVEVLLYLGLGALTGALPWRQIIELARGALRRRRGG